jgi:transcription elongation factor GreA
MNKYPISKIGISEVEKELEKIKKIHKPKVIEAIAIARDHGDLKENAEYQAAKEQQAFLESRLSELELIKETAEVIDTSSLSSDKILFGATVELFEENEEKNYTYKILSPYESDVQKGIIGINSPLARALLGKQVEHFIEFSTPSKSKTFKVLSIKYV